MQVIKQLGTLIEQATNDAHNEPPINLYEKILAVINSRVDMPKNTINAVSKRLSIKSKKVLFYCFDLLEYLSFRCELALYSQISTKEFLLKISGLLMAQDLDPSVQVKVLQTVKVWEELFRPHEDLLPMYFQFYAGLLRKEFPIQNNYVSQHRPKDFKIYKKAQPKKQEENRDRPTKDKPKVEPTKVEQKTFEQIREKIILTNEIIDNCNPAEGVKSNALLLEMMEQIKLSEKKINQTINENPNEKIMELALAANDDIYITYRRFKDLQKNRKPEPFVLAQLASDIAKEKEQTKREEKPAVNKQKDIFNSFDEKPSKIVKPEQKKAEIDIFDIACEPKQEIKSQASTNLMDLTDLSINSAPPAPPANVSIFDLLGGSSNAQPDLGSQQPQSPYSPNTYQQGNYLSGNNFGVAPNTNPYQTNSNNPYGNNNAFQSNAYTGISLGNNYQTENDIAKYDDRPLHEKITDLSDIFKK